MAYYSVPPPRGYYEYQPTASPASSRDYNYYVPSSYKTATLPSRRSHTRTASYSTPRTATYSTPAGYTLPDYYTSSSSSSPPPSSAKYEYVSIDPHKRTATRRFSMSSGNNNQGDKRYAQIRTSTQRIFIDTSERHHTDSSSSEDPIYVLAEPRLGRKVSAAGTSAAATKKKSSSARAKADSTSFYKQEEVDTPIRSRARRSSTATKQPQPSPPKIIKPPRHATAEDALEHNIPAGFCLKNWDPSEKPIVLLGSVFDANSLGKWIYDWTVFSHKSQSPLAGVAGELWLLLIRFAAKMQRAEEGIHRVKYREDKAVLTELLDCGDRVWRKLKSLIKLCEEAMWQGATKDGSRKVMGQKSGVAFVDAFFGRDGEMDKTERLMNAMRHFNMRFDSECEDILRSLKK